MTVYEKGMELITTEASHVETNVFSGVDMQGSITRAPAREPDPFTH